MPPYPFRLQAPLPRTRRVLAAALLATALLGLRPAPARAQGSGPDAGEPPVGAVREGVHEPELAERVVVRRTSYGVPHILAEDLRAAGFAMGWVQMEDYGERVVRDLADDRGELGLLLPADSLDLDDQARSRVAWRWAVEAWPELEADTRDVYEGFAAGVNRYLELHPAEVPEGARADLTGMDVLAGDVVGPAGPGRARGVLARLDRRQATEEGVSPGTGPEGPGAAREAGAGWGGAAPWASEPDAEGPRPDGRAEPGSNAWAIAPSRTESGNAILVRNPHLGWTAGYYEAHVTVPGILNFYGDFRIGGPFGIIGGFNERLGWATTNNGPDLEEVYALQADPERPDHYLFDGASLPLRHERVDVPVRNGDAVHHVARFLTRTHLGPVVRQEDGRIYVVRAADTGAVRVGEQFLAMARAGSLEEWKDAMRIHARGASHLTYADADGNAFYVWNARTPRLPHAPGGDTAAIPAARTADVWTRIVAFDSLPSVVDPTSGFIHNENDPFHWTDPAAPMDADTFPANFPEPRLRLRSQLSIDLLRGDEKLSLEEVVERKHSPRMLLAERVKPDLLEALADASLAEEEARAAELLRSWDNTVAADARGAVLFEAWWERYLATGDTAPSTPASAGFPATAASLFAEPWSEDAPLETPRGLADPARAVEAFRWAVDHTRRRWGSWDPAWGEVHRARVGAADLPAAGCDGILGCFRVFWFTEDEDGKRRVRGGDGWVLAVEFAEPAPRAYSILAYGQSAREDSPHHTDQLPLFARGEMKRVAFTEEAVEADLRRRYRPGADGAP